MNALILAVDTTHEFGSLALARGGELVEEMPLHSPEGFGHVLYGHLAALLERHGVECGDVDCFAAASGPGCFTGVRVGLACVKGLAEAAGSRWRRSRTFRRWRPSAARRCGPWCSTRAGAKSTAPSTMPRGDAVRPETVGKFRRGWPSCREGDIEFVATDFAPFRPALAGTRFEAAPVTDAPRALAGAIARIAAARFRQGRACDPAAVDANYVRRSDAELFWKE